MMTLKPGDRVSLFLHSRMDDVEGTVADDEPFVRRILRSERLKLIPQPMKGD
jgi:hypothetical protein